MSNSFCSLPWIGQAFRNNGDIRVCCQANQGPTKGINKRSDDTTFNAASASLDEARNSPLMKSIRKNMLAGEWHPDCKRCKDEEVDGLHSGRINANIRWNLDLDEVRQKTNDDGEINTEQWAVLEYDMRFVNLCNLACRMCGPQDSHTWYEQWSKYTGRENFFDTHGKVNLIRNSVGRLTTTDYDWHESERFWEQIEKKIENIRHVYMAGGEPLLIERHYEFLTKCIDADVAKSMVIEYNTNGTTIPNRVLELWKEFKEVRLGVSIDGIEGVVEYQRWPAKWSQLYGNLKKLNDLAEVKSNIRVWLTVTVTVYNVLHIADMIEWKLLLSNLHKINSRDSAQIITPHVVHRPENLNIRLLPSDYKLEVAKRYDESIIKLIDAKIEIALIERAKSIYNSIVRYMNSGDMSHKMQDFIEYTNFLDKERGQNIAEAVPSLAKYFNTEVKA